MSNNKIKRNIKRFERKLIKKHQELIESNKQTEAENIEKLLRKRQEKYQELKKEKLKINFAIKKNKELNNNFKKTHDDYPTNSEFKQAFKENKTKRNEVINQMKENYKQNKLAYAYEFETISYLLRRWFFGMGKEFTRISWMKRKPMIQEFIIVIIVVIILALVFLGIDSLFTIK